MLEECAPVFTDLINLPHNLPHTRNMAKRHLELDIKSNSASRCTDGDASAATGAKRQMYLDIKSAANGCHGNPVTFSSTPPVVPRNGHRVVSPVSGCRWRNNRLLALQKHKGITLSLNCCANHRKNG